jgi:hypothetical protein
MAAHYQNLIGEYFTTLIVTPSKSDESGTEIQAFQVSDGTMRIDQEGLFTESPDPQTIVVTEQLYICGWKRDRADVNVFLCAVRLRKTQSKFPNHTFPSPSQNPTPLDLKFHFRDTEFCPFWYQLFDFNLLLYLVSNRVLTLEQIHSLVPVILQQRDPPEELANRIEALT